VGGSGEGGVWHWAVCHTGQDWAHDVGCGVLASGVITSGWVMPAGGGAEEQGSWFFVVAIGGGGNIGGGGWWKAGRLSLGSHCWLWGFSKQGGGDSNGSGWTLEKGGLVRIGADA